MLYGLKFLVFSFFLASNALALDSLSYSGRLVNADGSPVTGTPDIQFNLSYTSAPTVVICSKLVTNVPLTKGVFHTKLDYTTADCIGAQSLSQVLALVPAGETIALQVTDVTNSKAYTYQAIHSIPSSIMSNIAKTLTQMGATPGQVLTWDGSKWTPAAVVGATGGTVTSINTGTGLTGGPITASGTISIAAGGVGTTEIANAGVTDAKISSGITRTKLANGTANTVVINNGTGVISEVAQLPIAQGGTGANTAATARTALGLGTAAIANVGIGASDVLKGGDVLACLANQKLQWNAGPVFGWTCAIDNDSVDNTKLPLDGSVAMTGALDMNSHVILGVSSPTDPGHAANKAYVDAQIGGVNASQWLTSSPNIYFNTGNVGIGTSAPRGKIDVQGTSFFGASTTNSVRLEAGLIAMQDGADAGRSLMLQSTKVNVGENNSFASSANASALLNSGSASDGTEILRLRTNTNTGFISMTQMTTSSFNMNFVQSGASQLFLKNDGNVGIGVTSPTSKLEIATDMTGISGLVYGTKILPTVNQSGSAGYTGLLLNVTETAVGTGTKKLLDLQVGGVTKFSVDNTGAVNTSLTTNGTTASYTSATGSQLSVGYDVSNKTTIDVASNGFTTFNSASSTTGAGFNFTGGKVGIGNAGPNEALDVTGNIKASGSVISSELSNIADLSLKADSDADASGALIFKTGTNERMRILNTGNIGIGTLVPIEKTTIANTNPNALGVYRDLDVTSVGPAGTYINLGARNGATFTPGAQVVGVLDNPATTGSLSFTTRTANSLSEKMRITDTGNVGIGTTSPSTTLHVAAATNSKIRLEDTTSTGTLELYQGSNSYITAKNALYLGVNNTLANSLTMLASGNVGIGTLTPDAKLHVNGNTFASNMSIGRSGSHYDEIGYNVNFTGVNDSYTYRGADYAASMRMGWQGDIEFRTATSGAAGSPLTLNQRMIIKQNGNVGIGTTAPSALLHAIGGVTDFRFSQGASNLTPTMSVINTNPTGKAAALVAGTNGSAFSFDSSGSFSILSEPKSNFESNSVGTGVSLMTFLSSGNVGIGTVTPGEKLDVSGNVRAVSFISTSDRNLKTNLKKVDGLKTVSKLNGYKFDWKKDGSTEYGVMAQEVEKVMPEAVVTNVDTNVKSVKYNSLIAPVIEAIKELFGEVNSQEKIIKEHKREIASLKQKNQELENRLKKIEERMSEKPTNKK